MPGIILTYRHASRMHPHRVCVVDEQGWVSQRTQNPCRVVLKPAHGRIGNSQIDDLASRKTCHPNRLREVALRRIPSRAPRKSPHLPILNSSKIDPAMTQINAVLFDYGMVLSGPAHPPAWAHMQALTGLSEA